LLVKVINFKKMIEIYLIYKLNMEEYNYVVFYAADKEIVNHNIIYPNYVVNRGLIYNLDILCYDDFSCPPSSEEEDEESCPKLVNI